MYSLNGRLLAGTTFLLLIFFGVTVLALDFAFRDLAKKSVIDRLDAQLLVLLAAAEPNDDGTLAIPSTPPESAFETLESGLYGFITDQSGQIKWQSQSALNVSLPLVANLAAGERRFDEIVTDSNQAVFRRSLGIEWEKENGVVDSYVFHGVELTETYRKQVNRFRQALFSWFAVLAVILLVAIWVLMRWILRPLRQVKAEIEDIEDGQITELSESLPRELRGVARSTNQLIRSERKRIKRYRESLDNLAHGLKTSLAVMRTELEPSRARVERTTLIEHIDKMTELVGYHLKKASAKGVLLLGQERANMKVVVVDTIASLKKVYAAKNVEVTVSIPEALLFPGDKGDLFELVGNLLDNAFKFSKRQIAITVTDSFDVERDLRCLRLEVCDDGDGVDSDHVESILSRGVRLDERSEGQGIGLALVRDIVDGYQGLISITRATLGGAKFEILLYYP